MPPSNSGPMPDEMEAKARRCFVCSLAMPPCDGLAALGWESEPDIFKPWRRQYRCPKHRHNQPALATIGEMQKAKP